MKDLHACARLVDEDERVTILHVETHLVGDDAAQRVEALAHVRRDADTGRTCWCPSG